MADYDSSHRRSFGATDFSSMTDDCAYHTDGDRAYKTDDDAASKSVEGCIKLVRLKDDDTPNGDEKKKRLVGNAARGFVGWVFFTKTRMRNAVYDLLTHIGKVLKIDKAA